MRPSPEEWREALDFLAPPGAIYTADRAGKVAAARATLESALAPPPVEDAAVEEALGLLARPCPGWTREAAKELAVAEVRAALASLRSQVAAKEAEAARAWDEAAQERKRARDWESAHDARKVERDEARAALAAKDAELGDECAGTEWAIQQMLGWKELALERKDQLAAKTAEIERLRERVRRNEQHTDHLAAAADAKYGKVMAERDHAILERDALKAQLAAAENRGFRAAVDAVAELRDRAGDGDAQAEGIVADGVRGVRDFLRAEADRREGKA